MRGARLAGQPLAVDDFQDVGCVDLAVDLGQGPAELDAAGRVAEALGKAIALLHAGNESADSTTGN